MRPRFESTRWIKRTPRGFSYLFVLFTIVLVGLSVMGANKQWTTMMQRERETELLFRGHQYRRAIASYVESVPGARRYPRRVEDLLKDSRNAKRHLRTAYLDPITGGPFVVASCGDGFRGVVSPSQSRPIKQDNFRGDDQQFRGAGSYREWVFEYAPTAPATPPPVKGGPAPPPPQRPPIPC